MRRLDRWDWLGIALGGAAVLAFLFLTPPSLLRKADYLGAVVCHRMPEHSFFIAGRQLPVCQRCTGTFSAALTAVLWQWLVWRRRDRAFPPLSVWLVMGAMALPWFADGFNSFTAMRNGGVGALGYAPQPWLRLLTGALMGTVMGVVLVAAFNQSFWAEGREDRAVVSGMRELFTLVAVSSGVAALIYSRRPWLLYPVSLYLALAIVALFTLVGAMVWVMAVGRENRYHRWREAIGALGWGLVFAAFIIGPMLALRLVLTGTVDGMPGL